MADEFAMHEIAESTRRRPGGPRPGLVEQAEPGPRRHALSRRGLRTARRAPAPPVARAAGPRLRGHRRPCPAAGRRAVRDVHQREPAGAGRAGPVPPGALPSHQRHQPDAPAAAASRHRHRAAGRVVPRPAMPTSSARPSRGSPATRSTSCSGTTGRATSASSRRPSSGPSPCASGPRITSEPTGPHHQPPPPGAVGTRPAPPAHGIRPLKEALEEPEKRIIIQALQAFNWNRQETARVLDINRTTLYKKDH